MGARKAKNQGHHLNIYISPCKNVNFVLKNVFPDSVIVATSMGVDIRPSCDVRIFDGAHGGVDSSLVILYKYRITK